MHIKFLGHGTGSARAAARYLTGPADHRGKRRAGVSVLRGNPEMVATVAETLETLHRYTSGVIAFAPEDHPTAEQIDEVLDDFERLAWAGFESDRYAWSAIRHDDDAGGCHVHIFAARVDLGTGKAHNLAPPGWQKAFYPLRDYFNHANGWARPDDPARARTFQPGHRALIDAAALRAGLELEEDPKILIATYLMQRIEAGVIEDRAGLIEALQETGLEITRQGQDYLSVRDPADGKKYRLKGTIYGADIHSSELKRQAQGEDAAGPRSRGEPASEHAATARRDLENAISRRAAYNRERYSRPKRAAKTAFGCGVERDGAGPSERSPIDRGDAASAGGAHGQGVERGAAQLGGASEGGGVIGAAVGDPCPPACGGSASGAGGLRAEREVNQVGAAAGDAVSAAGGDQRLADYLRQRLGDFAISVVPVSGPGRGNSATDRGIKEAPQGGDVLRGAADIAAPQGDGNAAMQRFPALRRAGEIIHDRIGNAASQLLAEAERAIRAGADAAGRANRGLAAAGAALDRAGGAVGALLPAACPSPERLAHAVKSACRRIGMNRDDELEQFKNQINLVEYAMAQGYALDRKESSANSKVLRHAGTADKIIVGTGTDGHGIYCSVRDDADHGSIIDFVQRRQRLNLGQVRKALRPWIGKGSQPVVIVARQPKPAPVVRDIIGVVKAFARATPCQHHPYLEARGISPATLADPRFYGVVRMDPHGAALFPHYDAAGLTGYEIKNTGFTGFAKGGAKAAWFSNGVNRARHLVIVETALDALSHAQLHPGEDSAYLSFAGQMSSVQEELVARIIRRVAERGAEIVIATDADETGDRYAEFLAAQVPAGTVVRRELPEQGKDWNDQLQARLGWAAPRYQAPECLDNGPDFGPT